MQLTILHFNDLHGRLEQLPRLFTLIQRERVRAAAAGRQTLLLDGGDSSDRGQWASVVTQGRANYSLLEAMGVQATVLGNADYGIWGRTALARLVKAVNFPVLAANLRAADDPAQPAVPGLRATVLLDLGGLPVGLLGVTQMFPEAWAQAGYALPDLPDVIERSLADLRGQGAQLIILLSHLGNTRTPAGAQWEPASAWHDDDVAAAYPDIGVIVGGHTHTLLKTPQHIGSTVVVQAGAHGQWLGVLDLDVDDATGAVTAYAGHLIACDHAVPPDPTIQGTLELVEEEAQRLKAIGQTRGMDQPNLRQDKRD